MDYSVDSVLRALDVLEYLATHEGTGRLSDIAKGANCSKNTTFRLLKTLQVRGFVKQADDASYELTFKLLNLGECVLRNTDLYSIARPYLEALTQQFGETASFAILDGREIVYLDRVLGRQPYHTSYPVGSRAAAYSTALGKAILAFSSDAIVREVLNAGLKPITEHTMTDPNQLLDELRSTAVRGYSYDDQENVIGIRCVAAPVFDRAGRVVAAISVSSLAARVTDELINMLAVNVKSAAAAMSVRLGSDKREHAVTRIAY